MSQLEFKEGIKEDFKCAAYVFGPFILMGAVVTLAMRPDLPVQAVQAVSNLIAPAPQQK